MNRPITERTPFDRVRDLDAKPLRILFLDDNPRDIELCIHVLTRAGFKFQADAIVTAQDFLAALQSGGYDLILSDYRIPGWNGVEAFKQVKQSGIDIPFILVTGTLGEESAVELIKEGVADYILKGRLARLPSAVHRALQEKAMRDEREDAHRSLRESEEKVRLLLDSTAEAILGIDLQGNCTFCNASSLRLLGYESASDLLGKNIHYLAHHTRADGTPYPIGECQIYPRFLEAKCSHGDGEVLWRKDGSSFPIEYWCYPVARNEKSIGSVVTFLDITERKRGEGALRRSKARFRRLIASSIIGMGTASLDGRFLTANEAFLSLLGIQREELLAGMLRWDEMTAPEYHAADRKAVDQLRKSGFIAAYEKEFIHKDGHRVAVLLGAVTLATEKGDIEVAFFVVDMSERKLLQQQLLRAQKMESIGQLAGGIAHDFNNLLSVIIGYSELLLEHAGLSGRMRIQCQEIKKAGDRAAALTRQLLAFSRQQVLAPRVLNLNTVVIETEKMLKRLIGEDIALRTSLDPALGSVKADPGQIEQVIMNLAVNARDAMPAGGELVIETCNVELDDTYAFQHPTLSAGPYTLLAVSDTGTGMNDEVKARIFEPFFTTKELGKGTGLGLSTVYGVVKQSGGHIFVYSELGHGTVFKIYLPRVDELARQSRPVDSESELVRGTETVLLVEDDESVRTLTRGFLEEQGYTVLAAANGNDALEAVGRHTGPIHLLLTDLVMPGMTGRALARRMVAADRAIKVLYVSGYTGNSFASSELLDAGADLVQKPFSRVTLLRKLREMLDGVLTND